MTSVQVKPALAGREHAVGHRLHADGIVIGRRVLSGDTPTAKQALRVMGGYD